MIDVERIEKLLREKNISRKQMFSDLGMSVNSLTNWKKGHKPNEVSVRQIADYLHVDVDYLKGITDIPDIPKKTIPRPVARKLVLKPNRRHSALDKLTRSAGVEARPVWVQMNQTHLDPRRRMLYELAENGTDDDIEAAVSLLDALRVSNPGFYKGYDSPTKRKK